MTDPTQMKPVFGITKLPVDETKAATSGAELLSEKLITAIEANGARLAWSRATICPCQGFNAQTRQPDPTCPKCQGGAVLYFGPKDYAPPNEAGTLDRVQELVLAKDGAAVIRGVIQRVTQVQDFYDVLGNWVRGTMQVTVRPENKLGYYDRLVNLDSEVPYSELVVQGFDKNGNVISSTSALPLRYLATGVNAIFTDAKRFEQNEDFMLEDGKIKWILGKEPLAGTRLSVHYLTHPTWLVIDHPHVLREIQRRRKVKPRLTPLGNPTPLPIQASVRLEFLPAREIPPPLPP
jgi:hypothetical protein